MHRSKASKTLIKTKNKTTNQSSWSVRRDRDGQNILEGRKGRPRYSPALADYSLSTKVDIGYTFPFQGVSRSFLEVYPESSFLARVLRFHSCAIFPSRPLSSVACLKCLSSFSSFSFPPPFSPPLPSSSGSSSSSPFSPHPLLFPLLFLLMLLLYVYSSASVGS